MEQIETFLKETSVWFSDPIIFQCFYCISWHRTLQAFAMKAELTFSWMIALETITLPIPYLTTTPDHNLKSSLLKPTSKLILISSLKEGTHTSLVTSLGPKGDTEHSSLGV